MENDSVRTSGGSTLVGHIAESYPRAGKIPATYHLVEHGLAHRSDDVVLVVSELATNAVAHIGPMPRSRIRRLHSGSASAHCFRRARESPRRRAQIVDRFTRRFWMDAARNCLG